MLYIINYIKRMRIINVRIPCGYCGAVFSSQMWDEKFISRGDYLGTCEACGVENYLNAKLKIVVPTDTRLNLYWPLEKDKGWLVLREHFPNVNMDAVKKKNPNANPTAIGSVLFL